MNPVGSDQGSAVVELVLLVVVLLVPLAYGVLAVGEVQRAAFGAAAASREAGRVFVTAPDAATAERRARAAAALVVEDQGARGEPDVRVRCSEDPCLQPDALVVTAVTVRVPLPFVPVLGDRLPPSVRVRAEHVEVVDRFRGARP